MQFFKKRYKFGKIHWKTLVLQSFFIKLQVLKPCTLLKTTPGQVFSCDFTKILRALSEQKVYLTSLKGVVREEFRKESIVRT